MFKLRVVGRFSRKHTCGTSCSVISPDYKSDEDVKLYFCSDGSRETSQKSIKEQVTEWRKKYQTAADCAIIAFKHESFSYKFNEDQLKCEKRQEELAFLSRFDESLVDLKFTGFEKPHVLVILLTDENIKQFSISEATSLLAATTRAQQSLSIIVMSNELKKYLEGVSQKSKFEHLLLSPFDSRGGNRVTEAVSDENIADRIAILVQQEDVESIKKLLSEIHKKEQPDMFKTAISKTFRQVMGKRKDANNKFHHIFDETMGWDVEKYFTVEDVIDWLETGYERGYTNNIDQFEHFLKRFFKLNPVPPDVIKSRFLDNQQNILYEACFCGSGSGIEHASKTLQTLIGVSNLELVELVVKRNYIIEGGERKESLLSLVTKTNKDFKAIDHLLDICLGLKSDRWCDIEQSITEAFRWPIKFRSFRFIKCMLDRDEEKYALFTNAQMQKIFTNALNEFGIAIKEVRKLTHGGNEGSEYLTKWLDDNLLKQFQEKEENDVN